MKVIYLCQYYATKTSTTSTRAYTFVNRLAEEGHEVTVITTDAFLKKEKPYKKVLGIKYYKEGNIEIKAIASNYSNKTKFLFRGLAFLNFVFQSYFIGKKEWDADIIFASSTPLTIGIPALWLKKKLKVPFVFEVRDLWPEAPIQMQVLKNQFLIKYFKSLEDKIYKSANKIISLSPGMTQGILATGVEQEKVAFIPNFSDIAFFEKNKELGKVENIRVKQQLKDKFVLAHIGAMGQANGLDYLVDVAHILKDEDRIRIMIVGDGMMRKKLQEKSERLGLKNIIFTGYIERCEVPSYTEVADITMTSFANVPILDTNSPNKFFDSLAAGKPIIVNSKGWTKDIVEKHDIGYFVDPENPAMLADLLLELKKNKNMLFRKGSKAKYIAAKEYDGKKLASQFVRILEKECK